MNEPPDHFNCRCHIEYIHLDSNESLWLYLLRIRLDRHIGNTAPLLPNHQLELKGILHA